MSNDISGLNFDSVLAILNRFKKTLGKMPSDAKFAPVYPADYEVLQSSFTIANSHFVVLESIFSDFKSGIIDAENAMIAIMRDYEQRKREHDIGENKDNGSVAQR